MTAGPHIGWLTAGSVLTVAGLGWGAFNVVDLLAHEVTTVTRSFDAAGVSVIDVANDTGRVVVTGTDTEEITIVARVSDGLRPTRNEARVVDGRLEVRGTCPVFGGTWCSLDYRIEVPNEIAVEVDADHDRVEIVDVHGELTVDNDNGSIAIRGAAGPVAATTDNGRIEATGLRSARVRVDTDNGRVEIVMDTPPETIRASSDNGNVEVVVPVTEDLYAVTTATDNGEVHNAVRTDPDSSRTIDASTTNGNVTIRYPD